MILWDFFKKGAEHRLRMLDIFWDSLGFFFWGGVVRIVQGSFRRILLGSFGIFLKKKGFSIV